MRQYKYADLPAAFELIAPGTGGGRRAFPALDQRNGRRGVVHVLTPFCSEGQAKSTIRENSPFLELGLVSATKTPVLPLLI